MPNIAAYGAHLSFYTSTICNHRNASGADTHMEESADARRVPSPLNGEKVAEGRMRGGNAQDSDSRDDSNPVASVITPHPALSPLRGEGALTTRSFHIQPQEMRWAHAGRQNAIDPPAIGRYFARRDSELEHPTAGKRAAAA